MDFTNVPIGTEVILLNLGPDEPFGGGTPGVDFDPADPASTGLVMQFRVKAATSTDTAILPQTLPNALVPVVGTPVVRGVSLNEEESATVFVSDDGSGNVVEDPAGAPFGPTAALLGTVVGGLGNPLIWGALITENPALNTTEEWVIHNFTVDAHPIHVHQVKFEVISRTGTGGTRGPEAWETGPKDPAIAYPGETTRTRMHFDLTGFYVWHCHIVEHEDNEMMRPFHVGPIPPDAPAQ
jgi:FtsP/CotA-like multicopper oxidase with cupredoxin domain